VAEIDKYFRLMVEHGTSDLHLCTGCKPMFRKDGSIVPLKADEEVTAERAEQLLFEITPEKNRKEFNDTNDTDFAYALEGYGRFRANIFRDHKGVGGVFRLIPSEILTFEQLKLPVALKKFCQLHKGLVLVTGPTGSGKSTTLAAMIDYINKNRSDHIITIEDPIEFVHTNQRCLINQREVHNHTLGFKNALRAALREDPDIVLVGEMRDLETTHIAIETAETGHLVFGTLHTTTAISTVDRLIDIFPSGQQAQIRTMLSAALKGVVAQNLIKKKGGGRIAALEVLVVNAAVSMLIREGKTAQVMSIMQTAKKEGMTLLNDELARFVKEELVEPAEAYSKAVDK
jgi:twitching motility protein PilT